MQFYSDVLLDRNGNVVGAATVTITDYPSGTTSTVYATDVLGANINPITANSDGEYSFYAKPRAYTITVSKSGITTESKVVTLQPVNSVISVKDYGAVGDGTTDDTAAIQAAIDAVFVTGGVLYFPAAVYLVASTLIFKNKIAYRGGSKDFSNAKGTVLKYTGTSDAVQINNPINSSTAANITIEDMAIQCTVRTAGKASLADVGSTFLVLNRVQFSGNDYGAIFDQTEIASVYDCHFEVAATGTAGLWLVNGAQHTGGGTTNYTNRITVERSQFHGNGGTSVGIADDGGFVRTFQNNNFDTLDKFIRVNGAYGLTISGNEMEYPITTAVDFRTTKIGGAAGSFSSEAILQGNFFLSNAAIPMLTFAASSLTTLTMVSDNFDNQNVGGTPHSGMTNVTNVVASGNTQTGTSTTLPFNNINQAGAYTPAWTAVTANPTLGNGTISGTWIRNGNSITATIALGIGTTSTLGTGEWIFSLPFATTNTQESVGAVYGLDNAVAFRAGVCLLGVAGSTVKCYSASGPTGWSSVQPSAWASGSNIRMTITYQLALNA